MSRLGAQLSVCVGRCCYGELPVPPVCVAYVYHHSDRDPIHALRIFSVWPPAVGLWTTMVSERIPEHSAVPTHTHMLS